MQNLTKLRHALAVSRTGSVTAAAQSLGSTQSTITKSLAAIEDELGFALFHRHARGMDVTERGEEFLTRASRIMADFDTLQADMNSDRQARNALLRLGITPASLQGLYNPAIRSLAASLPHVRVHVKATSPQHGLALLQRGDIELLIGPYGPMKGSGDLKVEQLADVSPRFFVRRGHPLEHCEHISATDLIAYPIVSPDLASSHASPLHEAFAQLGLADDETILDRTPDMITILLPIQFATRGSKQKIVPVTSRPPQPDPVLIVALRKAHSLLRVERGLPVMDTAPGSPYDRNILRLAFLAPDIQRAIIDGRQPLDLNLEKLKNTTIPLAWSKQRHALGFAETAAPCSGEQIS